MIVTAGKTNVSVYYYIVQDASGTSPGEPVTGLLFSDIETGGSASYARQGAARVDLTLKTLASASAAHDDGGFILVDDTNMPGVYRCDYPDAAFATGVDQLFTSIVVASANNAVAAPILIDITDVDLRDSVGGGMSRLDADVSSRMPTTHISATAGAVDDVTLVATTTTNTDMRGTDSAATSAKQDTMETTLNDVPTTAEFEARTILAASYFDPAADTVANVTLVATTTTNTDMRGTDGANTTVPDAAGVAPTAVEVRQEMDSNSVDFNTIITTLGTAGAGLTNLGGMSTAMKAEVLAEVVKLLTTQMVESYAANGVAPTLAQAQFAIHQMLMQFGIAGTSWTVRKLDDSTTAFIVTLNDDTNPTDAKRI